MNQLLKRLGSEDYRQRDCAQTEFTKLLKTGRGAVLARLQQSYLTAEDPEVKERLKRILRPYLYWRISPKVLDAIPNIADLLESGNRESWLDGVEKLRQIDNQQSREVLDTVIQDMILALKHEDIDVRRRAACDLVRVGGKEASQVLQALWENAWETAIERSYSMIGGRGRPLILSSEKKKGFGEWVLEQIGSEGERGVLLTSLESKEGFIRMRGAKALGELWAYDTKEKLTEALKDKEPAVRCAAAEALGKMYAEEAVENLCEMLRDADVTARCAAASALWHIGDKQALGPLLAALKDESGAVRAAVAKAIERLGADEKAVLPLVEALRKCCNSVRWDLCDVLADIGEATVEPLIEVLKDKDMYAREYAARALWKIRDDRALDPLITALEDKYCEVREYAARGLGEIHRDKAIKPLIAALKDENKCVRWSAASALGKLGAGEAVEPLIRALRDEVDTVRVSAVRALGEIGDKKAVEPLILALDDTDWCVSAFAADALGTLKTRKAVEPLIAALKVKINGFQSSTATALAEIGDVRAVEPIMGLVNHEDPAVRYAAVLALGKIADRKAVPTLISLIKDKNEYVAQYAADALGEIGDGSVIKPLAEALEYNASAASALAAIGGKQAAEALIEALSEGSTVQARAAHALGNMKEKSALLQLKKLWKETEQLSVKLPVAYALVTIDGQEDAFQTILGALKHSDGRTRGYAADMLGLIGDGRAVEPLIKALKDEDWSVRRDAAQALGKLRDPKAVAGLADVLKEEMADEASSFAHVVIEALATIGHKEATGPLIEALVARNYYQHRDVAEALKKVTGKDFGKSYDKWKQWYEENKNK